MPVYTDDLSTARGSFHFTDFLNQLDVFESTFKVDAIASDPFLPLNCGFWGPACDEISGHWVLDRSSIPEPVPTPSSYLIFLIATAPASLVLNQVKLPKDVMVQGLSGSIWHAKAQKVYVQNTVIENVNAELDVISLLSFSPSVDVTFGDAMLPGPEGAMAVSFVSGNLHINDANAGRVLSEPFQQTEFNETLLDMLTSKNWQQWQDNALHYMRNSDIFSMPEKVSDIIEATGQKRPVANVYKNHL